MASFEYDRRIFVSFLWKCWRVRRHNWVRTGIEVFGPFSLLLLLISVHSTSQGGSDQGTEESKSPNLIQGFEGRRSGLNLNNLIQQLCHLLGCAQIRSVLAFAPNTPTHHQFVLDLMRKVQIFVEDLVPVDVTGFGTESQIEAYNRMLEVTKGQDETLPDPIPTKLIGAIVFIDHPDTFSSKNGTLGYKIRLLDSQQFFRQENVGQHKSSAKKYEIYEESGTAALQLLVDAAFLELLNGNPLQFTTEIQPFPLITVKVREKKLLVIPPLYLPLAIILGLTYLATNAITEIVKEQDSGARSLTRLLGLSGAAHWTARMLNILLPASLSLALVATALPFDLMGSGSVIRYSDMSLIIFFLSSYALAAVWFCLFVTVILRTRSPYMAHSLGILAWTGSFILPTLLAGGAKPKHLGKQLLASLFPNVCLFWGFHAIEAWEADGSGVQWKNIREIPTSTELLSMSLIIAELLFDALFYMTLTLSIYSSTYAQGFKNPTTLLYDALCNKNMVDTGGKEGCCLFKTRCSTANGDNKGKCQESQEPLEISATHKLRDKVLSIIQNQGGFQNVTRPVFGEDVVKKVAGIELDNVTKSFKGKTILRSLFCHFYKNEITVLLGSSGAGKTTLLNILAGLMEPDKGTLYVNQYDVRDYNSDVRRSVGLCPQTEMLFEELTIIENLALFAWIKCGQWDEATVAARKLLIDLDLSKHSDSKISSLTSTQKRLLSVGIALAGNTKVILLDEPTAGLDAQANTLVWNVLQKAKEGKTILIATKNVEELDLMADRVAFLHEGTLKYDGTVEFIKQNYESQYSIKLCVAPENVARVIRFVKKTLPSAILSNQTVVFGGENLVFRIHTTSMSRLPTLFNQLYLQQEKFGVLSFDVRPTSIEEILFGSREASTKNQDRTNAMVATKPSPNTVTGLRLALLRGVALLKKQWWFINANCVLALCQFVIPLALVVIGIDRTNSVFRSLHLQPEESHGKIGTGDYFDPVSLYNIPDVALAGTYQKAAGSSGRSTHGVAIQQAIMSIILDSAESYRNHFLVGAELIPSKFVAFYNAETSAPDTQTLSVNLITSAIAQYVRPQQNVSIHVGKHHIKKGFSYDEDALGRKVSQTLCLYFTAAFIVILALALWRPVKEKLSGTIHLQMMTGLHPSMYWLTHLLLDVAYAVGLSSLAVCLVCFTQQREFHTANQGWLALFLIFLLGSLAGMVFDYFAIYFVSNKLGTIFGRLQLLHILGGLCSFMVYKNDPEFDLPVTTVFYGLFAFFPMPVVVHAVFTYAHIVTYNSRCFLMSNDRLGTVCARSVGFSFAMLPSFSCCPKCVGKDCFQPWSFFWTGLGGDGKSFALAWDLAILGGMCILYLILSVAVEGGGKQMIQKCCLTAPSEAFETLDDVDESVAKEVEKVHKLVGLAGSGSEPSALVVDGLSKNYGSLAALSNVSFSTNWGECFGVLGLSGSGKTSIFKVLTGEEVPAVGDAFILPYSLLGDRTKFLSSISYCAQGNSLLGDLTGLQFVRLFGELKGMSLCRVKTEAHLCLSKLGLEEEEDYQCKYYSEREKKLLCVAAALIGEPRVVLLDEPTAGLDATSKQRLWNSLKDLLATGAVVLIASHNVRECEIMCGRISVLVSGRLRRFTSNEEIHSLFLSGFTINIQFRSFHSSGPSYSPAAEARAEIEAILGECILRETQPDKLRYLLPQRNLSWGEILSKAETIRSNMYAAVESYTINSSSLEEVVRILQDMDVNNLLTQNHVGCCQRCISGNLCSAGWS